MQALQREQKKLLHLFYEDRVDGELLAAEQGRIDTERAEATRWKPPAARHRKPPGERPRPPFGGRGFQ
jgi:hypothetical protein